MQILAPKEITDEIETKWWYTFSPVLDSDFEESCFYFNEEFKILYQQFFLIFLTLLLLYFSSYWRNFVLFVLIIHLSFVPFVLTFLFVSTLVFDMAVLYENDAFIILVLSIKTRYSSFLKRFFVFESIDFKVKVLKTLKISSYCHIKTYWSLKRRAILKIPGAGF